MEDLIRTLVIRFALRFENGLERSRTGNGKLIRGPLQPYGWMRKVTSTKVLTMELKRSMRSGNIQEVKSAEISSCLDVGDEKKRRIKNDFHISNLKNQTRSRFGRWWVHFQIC